MLVDIFDEIAITMDRDWKPFELKLKCNDHD